jgi:GH15 family glucan-1,4-alpha-glucosidase
MKTIENLKKSVKYAIDSGKGKAYQYKVVYSAFKRAEKALRSEKEPALQEILATTKNEKHQMVLRLLFREKLKPKQIAC